MLNRFGKTLSIFIVLTIVLLVSSTSIGFYLYHMQERLYKGVKGDLENSRVAEQKLQAQLKDVQTQLALAEDKNKEADQKINSLLDEQDLNEGLRNALKKENVAFKAQIVGIEQSKKRMKASLDDAQNKLQEYQKLLSVSDQKSKELEEHLASLAQTNKDLQVKINAFKTGSALDVSSVASGTATAQSLQGTDNKIELNKIVVNAKDSTKGHILSVDTDADFVVFNLGSNQSVKTDAMLSVYRDGFYLGDIKATRVQDEMSAADIVAPLSSKQIRKNDTVVLKP